MATLYSPTPAHWTCSAHGEEPSYGNVWLRCDIFKNEAEKNYIGNFYVRMDGAANDWEWSGKSQFAVTVNGVSSGYVNTQFRLNGRMDSTDWVGPVAMTLNPNSDGKVVVTAHIDARRTSGYYGGRGPSFHGAGAGANGTDVFFPRWDMQVETIEELKYQSKPSISNLRNNCPNNGKNTVSEYENSIQVVCDLNNGGSAITSGEYSIDNGITWVPGSKTNYQTIRNLTPNTIYYIKVRYRNALGITTSSTCGIRTKLAQPTTSTTSSERTLEHATITWSTAYPVETMTWETEGCTINGSTSGTINPNGDRSGTVRIKFDKPGEQFRFTYHCIATETFDSVESSGSIVGSTNKAPSIQEIGDLIFGLPINIKVRDSSNNKTVNETRLIIKSSGNGRTAEFEFKPFNANYQGEDVILTQDKWDQLYKIFTNTNSIQLKFKLITKGDPETGNIYTSEEITKTMILTGIAKTAHTGISNSPRRVQVWVGDSSTSARRCVTWVGVDSRARRCI